MLRQLSKNRFLSRLPGMESLHLELTGFLFLQSNRVGVLDTLAVMPGLLPLHQRLPSQLIHRSPVLGMSGT
jgi:hypothetical protein